MKLFLVLLIFLLSCTPGNRITLHEDNDYFKPTKNNDKNFSQGLRMALEIPDKTGSTSYFFGNNFYTPDDKAESKPILNDRPYAGYTYVGADFKYTIGGERQDVFGITGGIVGPHSYSEQFQNEVHRLLGQNTAKGWGNQLDDEFGLILKAETNRAFLVRKNFDVVNTFGAHFGNVFTQGYFGSNFRYGHRLPSYFSSPGIIYPRLPKEDEDGSWAYYVFGGPVGRVVAHNIFLDGNTFEDSQSVDRKLFVAEGRVGFAVEKSGYRFAYTYILHTKEFDQDVVSNDFGEITLSKEW